MIVYYIEPCELNKWRFTVKVNADQNLKLVSTKYCLELLVTATVDVVSLSQEGMILEYAAASNLWESLRTN